MKKQFWFLLALPLTFLACNNSTDSVDSADSANAEKRDSANTRADSNAGASMAVDQSTSEFMVKAANDGMAEVELGRVAENKARNARVKEFAAMMVRDHSKANDELKGMARQKNVTLPDSVSNDSKDMMKDLNKKTGNDFDRSYMKMMEDDHEKAVNLFEKCSNDTKNSDVKSWVDKTLPTLRAHLDSARSIRKAFK